MRFHDNDASFHDNDAIPVSTITIRVSTIAMRFHDNDTSFHDSDPSYYQCVVHDAQRALFHGKLFRPVPSHPPPDPMDGALISPSGLH
ncbi:hypothetical protein E2C01_039136 [Portunus trituberculatus]|uniref:Uncharacterized protein n=1 Tax=Portunus trituberculatus TaxID=210409 RepID=A0A5B7FIT7_PORTR|nr:hypothetical protein [Portunus trituberculatus]